MEQHGSGSILRRRRSAPFPEHIMRNLRRLTPVALCANEGLGSEAEVMRTIAAESVDVLCFSSYWVGTLRRFHTLGASRTSERHRRLQAYAWRVRDRGGGRAPSASDPAEYGRRLSADRDDHARRHPDGGVADRYRLRAGEDRPPRAGRGSGSREAPPLERTIQPRGAVSCLQPAASAIAAACKS